VSTDLRRLTQIINTIIYPIFMLEVELIRIDIKISLGLTIFGDCKRG